MISCAKHTLEKILYPCIRSILHIRHYMYGSDSCQSSMNISAYNFIYEYFIETCIATFFTSRHMVQSRKKCTFFHTYSLCVFYLFWFLKVMKSVKCECSVFTCTKKEKKRINKMSEYLIHSCYPLLLPLERVQCILYVSVCVCLCICFCTHVGL